MQSKFIVVDDEKDFEGTKPDGIIGLSNDREVDNIFDLAYKEGQLNSTTFAF